MTLDDILAGLEKSAADAAPDAPGAKQDEKTDKEVEAKEKKEEGKDGEGETEAEKTAAFKQGADLAKEIMEKVASTKVTTHTNTKDNEMNKEATLAGKALAEALMKKAGVGDITTTNGIPGGVTPSKIQIDQAAQKAEHDMIIQATPGTDGKGNGGSLNQIFDAIVSDAMAQGVKDNNVTGNTAQAEGAPVARGAPNQVPTQGPEAIGEAQEKTAAVQALVNNGFDFDEAVNLVKAASDELAAEHNTQVKKAAFDELLAKGISFTEAANMVKAASAKTNVDQEKQAALEGLLEAGVDFDQALDLVNAKAEQLYGK